MVKDNEAKRVKKENIMQYIENGICEKCSSDNLSYYHKKTDTGEEDLIIACDDCGHTLEIRIQNGLRM